MNNYGRLDVKEPTTSSLSFFTSFKEVALVYVSTSELELLE